MKTVLRIILRSTENSQTMRRIDIPINEASMIIPRITHITHDGAWYFRQESVDDELESSEKMGATEFNSLFLRDQTVL